MEENSMMGMTYDVDVTTLAAALPEPTIVMTGKESYSIADTADYPLMELNLYGKSTQDGTPTPEYPIPIESVGDDGAIEVTACGKNLLDVDSEYYHANKGYVLNFIPLVLTAGTYTVSFTPNKTASAAAQITVRNDKGSIIASSGTLQFNEGMLTTFTFELNTSSSDFGFYVNVSDITLSNIQLERGSTPTTYEPYKGCNATIISGLPLCSIGDVRDELIYNADGTGKIIKHTKKIVIDGTSNSGRFMSYSESTGFVQWNCGLDSSLYIDPSTKKGKVLSSHLIEKLVGNDGTNHCLSQNDGTETGTYIRCWIKIDGVTNSATLNAWLANNPITFVAQTVPYEIELSAEEIEQLVLLQSYREVTNIYNDENAEMRVKVLRRDFDVKHIDWIKESQTWVCPKAGKWKVICVGGGASGGIYDSTTDATKLTPTTAGGTTSFGSIVSAEGAPSTADYSIRTSASVRAGVSGYGGYTGTSYGGVPMIGAISAGSDFGAAGGTGNAAVHAGGNPRAAVGYGAGGGAVSYNENSYAIPGRAGSIESTIVDIDEGRAIMCTVGKGGQRTLSAATGSGADGVIVVQYLGY